MKALLSMLPNSDGEFMNYCGSLYNSAIENACAPIKLAAHARRIMTDLYDSSPTPIEQYADSLGEDADGFEEAVEDQPEAEELGNDDGFEEKNEED